MSHTYKYPRPSLTVDCVVFGIGPGPNGDPELQVLLIERADEPFKGSWALPGGFVNVKDDGDQGEGIEVAARRELEEETGIQVDYLEQLYTFGTPGRDPRGRVVSVAYYALVRSKDHVARAGSDAKKAKWVRRLSLAAVAAPRVTLAFDHAEILDTAFERLRTKVRYAPIGFNLLPSKFTLPELQQVYEVVLERKLDKRNFRKRILAMDILVECGNQGSIGKPGPTATLYRFDKRAYDKAVRDGFNFEI